MESKFDVNAQWQWLNLSRLCSKADCSVTQPGQNQCFLQFSQAFRHHHRETAKALAIASIIKTGRDVARGNIMMLFPTKGLSGAHIAYPCMTCWPRLGHRATLIMRRLWKVASSISHLWGAQVRDEVPGKRGMCRQLAASAAFSSRSWNTLLGSHGHLIPSPLSCLHRNCPCCACLATLASPLPLNCGACHTPAIPHAFHLFRGLVPLVTPLPTGVPRCHLYPSCVAQPRFESLLLLSSELQSPIAAVYWTAALRPAIFRGSPDPRLSPKLPFSHPDKSLSPSLYGDHCPLPSVIELENKPPLTLRSTPIRDPVASTYEHLDFIPTATALRGRWRATT